MSHPPLVACYNSPTSTQVFSHELRRPPKDGDDSSVDKKTAYLAELRGNAAKLQAEVNSFLTRKMDEEKAAEAEAYKGARRSSKKDEEREEEMYGEEDPEQDG
ncbi:hypothetical protein AC578_509 [Pseudocercospora eumusae]|uniref:EKC/KEOPS complex subunit GON7 n=1 Tax=Pseudocercospora eumusae TaxID=321146 RepID=A0A139HXX9_9PEZI|nr:hypothetical protein AC578_509 [Pseudocercospora eumusae]